MSKNDKSIITDKCNKYRFFLNNTNIRKWARINIVGGSFVNDKGKEYKVSKNAAVDVYCYIGEYCVGYGSHVTKNLSYQKMIDDLSLSKMSVYRAIQYLIDKKYIIRLKNKSFQTNGKESYKYMLNFDICKIIDCKTDFPSINTLNKDDNYEDVIKEYDELVHEYDNAKELDLAKQINVMLQKAYRDVNDGSFNYVKFIEWVKVNRNEFYEVINTLYGGSNDTNDDFDTKAKEIYQNDNSAAKSLLG